VIRLNERLKKVRLFSKLSQEEFGKRIGIESRAHISSLEKGNRNITDRIINDVCREFNVNEDWLRYGTGEMTQKLTKNQEIGAFANEVMKLPDEAFKKRFIDALKKLDEKDWKHLEEIASKLLKED